MDFDKYNIGFGITGSFCTFAKARKAVEHLCEMGANVIPIFQCTDLRYQVWQCQRICGGDL